MAIRLMRHVSQLDTVAVGFSGVLFGLLVVLEWEDRHTGVSIFKLALSWAWEILLCQVLAPGASWLGHTAGALAGAACAVTPPGAQAAAIAAALLAGAGLLPRKSCGAGVNYALMGASLQRLLPWRVRSRHVYLQ
jgi:hypothetical protein